MIPFKKLFSFSLMLLTLSSCQSLSRQFTLASKNCPTRPDTVLKPENVKAINLSDTSSTELGILQNNQTVGYIFEGKSGQQLNYKVDEDVCVWIFTPDQQLLTTTQLPIQGKYLIQVSPLKGSRTFSLNLSLQTAKDTAASISPPPTPIKPSPPSIDNSPTQTASPQFPSLTPVNRDLEKRPSPEQAIENYYALINQRQYNKAWNQLAENLRDDSQLHPNGYYSYLDWWQKVDFVNLREAELINSNSQSAIVGTRLTYRLNSGREINQSLQFFLSWNEATKRWEMNKVKLK